MLEDIKSHKHQTHPIPRSPAPALCHQPFEGSLEHPKLSSAIARLFDSNEWQSALSCSYLRDSGCSIVTRKKNDTNNSLKFVELHRLLTQKLANLQPNVSCINTQQLQWKKSTQAEWNFQISRNSFRATTCQIWQASPSRTVWKKLLNYWIITDWNSCS